MNTSAPQAAQIDALIAEAHAQRHTDARAALACAEQAHTLALRCDHQRGLAHALLRRAVCLSILGAVAPAGEDCDTLLQQAVSLMRSLGDRAGEAEALNQQGLRLAMGGHGERAIALYAQVRALRAALGDRGGEAAVVLNIAIQHRHNGDLAAALACGHESLELAHQAADARLQAYALTHLGLVLALLDEPAAAEQHLAHSLALVRGTTDRAHESTVLVSLSQLKQRAGDAAAAQALAEQALGLARGTGNLGDMVDALVALAQALQARGEHAAAVAPLHEATLLAQQRGDLGLAAEVLLAQAETPRALGRPLEALALLAQAHQQAEAAGALQLCALAHEGLSLAHEAAGDLAAALRHQRAFQACERRLRNQPAQRRLRQFLQQQELASAENDAQAERQRSAQLLQALDEARRAEQSRSQLLAELQAQAELLQQLAREDGLTGVANRRWLDLQLQRETERAQRFGHALAVAMVDVDHFKAVNDRLSHGVGDAVLRTLATLLRRSCRASDVVGRYGGEEFMLIFVESAPAQALEACEKLRERVAAHVWSQVHPALQGLSVSIGVAGFAAGEALAAGAPAESLVERADRALYRAKNGGRNRVCS